MKVFIGTSGWQYKHWNKKFFPADLPKKSWLKYLSSNFNSVELNTSFYHIPPAKTFTKWSKEVSNGFLFAVKLNRRFTHLKRLRLESEDKRLLRLFVSNTNKLKTHMGPILIQLPPSLKKDLEGLVEVIKGVRGEKGVKAIKIAVEFRHKSWFDEETYDFLKKNKVALVITSSPHWHSEIRKTTDWVYVRFHGETKLFASNYRHKALRDWANRLLKLKAKAIYCYFNNDANAYAAENALYLKSIF